MLVGSNKLIFVLLAGSLAVACGKSAKSGADPGDQKNVETQHGDTKDQKEAAPMTDNKAVELSLVGEQPGKPPRVNMLFDVTLRNTAAEARWFVLPSLLTVSWQPPSGGVHTLQIYDVTGKGRAVLGSFIGNGGFHALLVPAGGTLTVHELPISLWEEKQPEGPVPVEVIIAKSITLGGETIESWFPSDPTSDSDADVRDRKMTASKKQPNLSEAAVVIDEESRHKFEVGRKPALGGGAN
jgi:hypothetical protein